MYIRKGTELQCPLWVIQAPLLFQLSGNSEFWVSWKTYYIGMLDYTIDHTGDQLKLQLLSYFQKLWVGLEIQAL